MALGDVPDAEVCGASFQALDVRGIQTRGLHCGGQCIDIADRDEGRKLTVALA